MEMEKRKATYTFERDVEGNYTVYGSDGTHATMDEDEFKRYFEERTRD